MLKGWSTARRASLPQSRKPLQIAGSAPERPASAPRMPPMKPTMPSAAVLSGTFRRTRPDSITRL